MLRTIVVAALAAVLAADSVRHAPPEREAMLDTDPAPLGVSASLEQVASEGATSARDNARAPNAATCSEEVAVGWPSALAGGDRSSIDIAAARRALRASSDAEHRAAAALLASTDVQRAAAIAEALAADPNHTWAVWHAVGICAAAQRLAQCPAERWEQRLVQLDAENSEAWRLAADGRFRRGERAAALEALRMAAAAPATREYWGQTVAAMERALAAAGGYSFAERAALAFDVASSTLPDYAGITAMCKQQSEVDAEWADVCRRYGQRLEVQSRTELGTRIGRALQIVALEARGDTTAIASLEVRQAATPELPIDERAVAARLLSSPTQLAAYVAAVEASGEREARRRLAEAIARGSSQGAADGPNGCGKY